MNYYQRLKDLREDHELTQEQAAKIIGCKQSYYGKYERGQVMMGIDKYIAFAKYYNVSLDYLTGIIDRPLQLSREKAEIKNSTAACTIEIPGEETVIKKLTPKQAQQLKQFLEILIE